MVLDGYGSMDKNIIIFGVDMTSSVHLDNKKKDILILGKGPTKVLDDTMLIEEAQYSINFSRSIRKLYLSLHYMGVRGFYLLMLQKNINSKQQFLK